MRQLDSITRNMKITNLYIKNPSVISTSVPTNTLPSFDKSSPIPRVTLAIAKRLDKSGLINKNRQNL